MRQVITFPGTEGSFTSLAAKQVFPDSELIACTSFDAAAQAVVNCTADYCVLPIENSFAGAVLTTYQLLEKHPLFIVGETTRRVRHQLLGVPGAKISDVRCIASHPQAIAQCDAFLETLPGVQIVPSVNTAVSAREVSEKKDPSFAAIASEEAAEAFGLEILARDIQTSQTNTTRFVILSRGFLPLAFPDKATVVFTVKNEVGALLRVLDSFARSGLNMSRIESRPIPNVPFRYDFWCDFQGIVDTGHLQAAIEQARPCVQQIRLLGVYPKGENT